VILSLRPDALITWNIAQPLKQPSALGVAGGGHGPTIGIGTSVPAR
jgi:hypothetical protein